MEQKQARIMLEILYRLLLFIRLFPTVFKGPKLGINIKLEIAGRGYIAVVTNKKSTAILYLAYGFLII